MKKRMVMGCIADDFTGASDAASFLEKGGLKTILYNGIPGEEYGGIDCDAVVIALKTRTAVAEEAVRESLEALEWLRNDGAAQLYIKYCSTFDSTRTGNIGPVVDAAMEMFQTPYTLLCPSLPVNGRTVRDGRLLVNGLPLHETHMRHHPLTPMWDDRIEELMRAQGKHPCISLSIGQMQKGREYVEAYMKSCIQEKGRFYVIPDYYEEGHKELIYGLFGDLPLLTGGSGILASEQIAEDVGHEPKQFRKSSGKTILFAGSCSQMTLNQIEDYRQSGQPVIKINPISLLKNEITEETLWSQIEGRDQVLVYCADTLKNVRKNQAFGKEKVAGLLEHTISSLAKKAVESGYTQIVVAGGETSGAVTRRLGYYSYIIGASAAPGVPMMIPTNDERIRLVLKSGNFGQPDFFRRAVHLLTGEEGDQYVL